MAPSNTGDAHSSIPPRNSATVQPSGPDWDRCKDLACQPRILDCFVASLRDVGLVGEERVAKIIYLAVTSRLLDRPVSVAVKGISSGGKSYLVQRVIQFFPDSAYYALSATPSSKVSAGVLPCRNAWVKWRFSPS